MGSEADDVWLASLPLAHVGGLALVLRALAQGCGLAVPPEPVVAALDGTIRRHRVTHLSLVPTQLRRWLDLRGDAPPPGSLRCVLVGGAACPPELLTRARAHGLPVRATYGLTEACSQVATADAATPLGSVGLPLAGLQIRIQEPDAGSAASGRIGRILVRGPTLFLGYLGDDAATADALRDGWLWTRDLGRLDEDGRLWVVGRLDDVIVTGGENVDPVEVEAVLEDHPDVQEAAVVAAPDAEWGQLVVACIVPRPGANPTLDGLREHCASRLAKYKCPRRLLIVEHLPRTGMGKVRRSALRAQAASPSLAP
jgi:o-succinylbenzoate---CoA ligase